MQLCIGEDEVSFKRHNKILVSEKAKVNPNMMIVNELMDKTFYMRREDITNNPCVVSTLLSKYPFLSVENQVTTFIITI